MSDVKTSFLPRYRKPETAMDLLDPAQHFQGETPSEKDVEQELMKTEAEEKAKVESERLEAKKIALEKKRGRRKQASKRVGRRASIITGPMGIQKEPEIRRATLG